MKRSALLFAILVCCAMAASSDTPKRPRITDIDHVRFFASDLDTSHAFYNRVLGLPSSGGGCAGNTRTCFAVNVMPDQQLELGQVPSPSPKNWVAEVAFVTNDLAQMRGYLLARGVVAGTVSEGSDGAQHFELRDPEGNPLAFVQRPQTAVNYRTSANQISNRLLHAGFVVHDRATTERFYKDILGFRPYWHGGMKDDQTDWVSMQVPDGTDWLEFMVNVEPDAGKKLRGIMNHIALGVPDIHAAEKQLRANGWNGTEEPKIGRDGKWQLNLYDPDDTRIEFMEFTPVQKPCCSEFTGPHPKP